MKVLSLFDGIAGARQALKNLNIECEYYASEIDKYAMQVAKNNHSDIIHIGDVKEVKLINDLDLIIGGSPCQDLSIAKNNRKGLDGERSGLFYEYMRILKECKPKFFVLENVASMSKESNELISNELFNIEPILINSSLLTAQQRKRLYWVGKLQQDGSYKKVGIEQPQDRGVLLKDIVEYQASDIFFINEIALKTFTKNNKVKGFKDLDEKANCLTATTYKGFGNDGCSVILDRSKIRKLTTIECERLQGFPDNYTNSISNTQAYKCLGNSFTIPIIEHIIKSILEV